MKVILVRTTGELPEVVETPGGLQEWYRLIGCRLIDVTSRRINGRYFDFIVDDEGFFTEKPIPTAVNGDKGQLVGNLVICNCNDEGEETGLTNDDIKHILSNVVRLSIPADPEQVPWYAITNVDY